MPLFCPNQAHSRDGGIPSLLHHCPRATQAGGVSVSIAMPNSIHNLDTRLFKNESGEFPAIVMGLNVQDRQTVDSFLNHVVEQFKNQRMCSPPDTANMTITIAGEMTAEEFRTAWASHVSKDPILKHFMSLMVLADVLHIRGRELLDRASLISPP